MFAGAAFTDEADIKATDAVNMLTALGVIEGDPDGSFRPDATVTRAEMAKMIFVVRNNTIDDSAYENNSSKLTDINSHWAKGYIKFCESQGIIAGYGDNTFKPDATVTGVEAAKMLLVLAGYDADKAGLVGHDWSTNTLRYAGSAGILDDVNSGLESGLPRQYAAQMIANTLDTNRVKWSTDSDSFDDILNGGVKETVGSAYMGLSYDYGTLTTITSDSLTVLIDDSYDSDNYHQSTKYTDVTFSKVGTDYSDLLGQKVKVMFKDGKTNNVLGVYAISDNTVYETYLNKTEMDGEKIKFGGSSYSVEDMDSTAKGVQIDVIVDGATAAKTDITDFDDTAMLDGNNLNKVSMNKVVFVDTNSNNKIDTAIITTYTGGEVTYVGSDKITFAGESYEFDDENIDEEIVKDDFAVMSKNLYEDCKDIVRADILTTELTGIKEKDGYWQYELDGTWYNAKDEADVDTGDTVKAYVYNGIALDISADDSNGAIPDDIAVVVGVSSHVDSLNGDQAKLRFFNGTTKTVTMSDDSVNPKLGNAYKVSGSDSDCKLEVIDSKKYNGYLSLLGNGKTDYTSTLTATAGNTDTIANEKVADDAVIILYTELGRSKQINGKQFKSLSEDAKGVKNAPATAVFTKETDGLNRVKLAAIKVSSTDLVGESSDNYAYIVTAGVKASGGVKYTIWTGSENVTVTEDISYSKDTRAKGTLIGYSDIDEDGIINDVKDYGTIKAADDVNKGDTLNQGEMYRGGNEASVSKYIAIYGAQFNVTADTTVLLVDSKADDDKKIGLEYTYGDKLPEGSKYKDGADDKYLVNAFWIMDETGDDDADIEVLVIDSTGAFDGFELDDVNAPKLTAVKTSGDASTTKGTEATLKYTLTASNYAADAADVTTSINSEDNVNITASGDGTFAVKNNGTQEIIVTVGTSTAIGTYNIQIKAGNTVLLTDTFEVTAKPVATLNAVTASDSTTTFTEAGKVKAGVLDTIVGKLKKNETTNVKASFKIVANDRPSADTSVYTPVAGEKVTITATFTPDADYAITATAAPTLAGTNADADSFSVTNGIATATYTFTVVA